MVLMIYVLGRWAVYKNGKIVIITTSKRIAETYADERANTRQRDIPDE